MSDQESKQNLLENLWIQKGVWRRSGFARNFLKRARDKILCLVLGDEESIAYFSQAREITMIDMACGTGMASVGLIDFIQQAMKGGIIQREAPLTVHFLLNDLNEPCIAAAKKNVELIRQILAEKNRLLHIGSIHGCIGSISEIVPFIKEIQTQYFGLLFFCNAFDHVLMYGHKAIEKDPQCSDPIAHARPCDRPALLAKLFQQLGLTRILIFHETSLCRSHATPISSPLLCPI